MKQYSVAERAALLGAMRSDELQLSMLDAPGVGRRRTSGFVGLAGHPPVYGKIAEAHSIGTTNIPLAVAQQLAMNEEAASLISESLQMTDLVPATVTRPIRWGDGRTFITLSSNFNPIRTSFTWNLVSDDDVIAGHVFDVVIDNRDRNTGNVRVAADTGSLVLFDHEFSLGDGRRVQPRTACTDEFNRRNLTIPDIWLERASKIPETVDVKRLSQLVPKKQILAMYGRAQGLR